MPTTVNNLLSALRAQRTIIKAGTDDKVKLRAVNRAIREILGTDDAQDIRDAWTEVKDSEANPAVFFPPGDEEVTATSERQFRESAALLVKANLPEDDPDPAVVDRKKVKLGIKRTAENAAVPASLQRWCFARLEQHFDTYLDTRPAETQFPTYLTPLNSGAELSAADLLAAVNGVMSLHEKAKP